MTTRETISYPTTQSPAATPSGSVGHPIACDPIRAHPIASDPITAHPIATATLEKPLIRTDLSPTITAIVEELQRTFFGVLPAAAVAQCATKAVQDLLGSICLQALPEMAIRLATVRLEAGDPPADN